MIESLYVIVFLSNLIIGILLGISGISGFLLPLIYVGFLHLPLRDSLALSFSAFAVAGVIGSYSYWKFKNMNTRLALFLSIGSLPGAYCGVLLNVLIPDNTAKLILYGFILFSGISILFNKSGHNDAQEEPHSTKLLDNTLLVILIGFIVAVICSLTGAGGPILLVPLLVNLGVNVRVAVGVSLLNSVIIAIPAIVGYLTHSNIGNIVPLITQSLLGSTIGIITGVFFANKVQIRYLRIFIAFITIVSSVYMLSSFLF